MFRMNKKYSLLGPAYIAAVAYIDPGNVASNLAAGTEYGYSLIWVLVLANFMAVIIQYLSAKLAYVSGKSLTQIIASELNAYQRILFWIQAEIVAIATDLAELIGGSLALSILFNIPLIYSCLIVVGISILILATYKDKNYSLFQITIIGLLLTTSIGFCVNIFFGGINFTSLIAGLKPRFEDKKAIFLAVSMLGATVMPHAIYVHSSLILPRINNQEIKSKSNFKLLKIDAITSLFLAGTVNIGILITGAINKPSGENIIEELVRALNSNYGTIMGVIFILGLLASGVASSSVGNYFGMIVMQDLLKINIPILLRRAITALVSVIIIAIGINPTTAMIVSQIFLSLGIPFALVPLFFALKNKNIMGKYTNTTNMNIVLGLIISLITLLNIYLIISVIWI